MKASRMRREVGLSDERRGVLLIHGFGGSPASMQSWATFLEGRGYATSVPLLPGHGTRWQDLSTVRWTEWYAVASRALAELSERCESVAIAGLSMGGALALRLAAERPDDSIALLLVNPRVAHPNRLMFALPVLQYVVPSIANDGSAIAKPGVARVSYDRLSLKAVRQMTMLWRDIRPRLREVRQPILLFRSIADGASGELSRDIVFDGVGSADRCEVILTRSNHLATLDYDAGLIFSESERFLAARIISQPKTALQEDVK
jgi:carboxylesterase